MGKETVTTKSENDQDYIYDIVDSIYKDIQIMFKGTRSNSDDDVKQYIRDNIQATYGKRKRWRQMKLSKEEIFDEVVKELFGEK
tara:strand:- start:1231 stop:1482 length:252 start_codon:yes stop_codon:yes gene_type:complete